MEGSAGTINSFVQFLTVLIIFALVLAMTYIVTKYIGRFQKNQGNGLNIEVLEANRISQNTLVEIVRIGNRYAALAVSKDNVSFLFELDRDDFTDRPESTPVSSFGDYLKFFKNNINDKSVGKDE